mgnify:CR=1 FL=1
MIKKTSKKEQLIGEVTHYYGEIKVAVIQLKKPLSVGDTIRITGGEDTDFTQEVKSMEVDHEKIKKAKAKKEVGMKVKKKVRDGYKVYKIQ